MDLKKFTKELITEWKKCSQSQQKLAGIAENKDSGFRGEKSVLAKFKKEKSKYQFTATPKSWSPADIIVFRKTSDFWHFALYQVKTSMNEQNLTSEIDEKDTLPILAGLLKSVYLQSDQTKYYKNKPVYITIGYIGVHNKNHRNSIVKRVPYQNDFSMNGLNLTSREKTKIRNYAHR